MKALVVGGSSGIGLSIALNLVAQQEWDVVYVIDKNPIPKEFFSNKMQYVQMDLVESVNHQVLNKMDDISALYITAGFGHLKYFQELDYRYIENSFAVNTLAPIEIIRHYYERLLGESPFYCGVMVSHSVTLCYVLNPLFEDCAIFIEDIKLYSVILNFLAFV